MLCVNSSRRFVASSYVQLFRVLISQSMYPVKWRQEWCGALYSGPGVCRGTSQCCSESEHWRGCSTDSPTSDGRQQSSCSLSPSGDPSLSSANLLIHTKNANMLHAWNIHWWRTKIWWLQFLPWTLKALRFPSDPWYLAHFYREACWLLVGITGPALTLIRSIFWNNYASSPTLIEAL